MSLLGEICALKNDRGFLDVVGLVITQQKNPYREDEYEVQWCGKRKHIWTVWYTETTVKELIELAEELKRNG